MNQQARKLFGTKLRLLRKKKGLSQEKCCIEVSCTHRTWVRWEKGETYPLEVYRKLITKMFPGLGLN